MSKNLSVLEAALKEIIKEELEEMAIGQFNRIGDFNKAYGFRNKVDRKILTSERGVEKIKRQWQKTSHQFDMWFVNDKRVKGSEFFEVGEVDMDYVRTKMGLTPEEFPEPNPDAITIIFTNNKGDRSYMASGWILAHRLGHALRQGKGGSADAWGAYIQQLTEMFTACLKDVYGIDLKSTSSYKNGNTDRRFDQNSQKILLNFAHQMGSQKSSRDGNLNNWYEFAYELFAQYLLTGKIKLNPLPDSVVRQVTDRGQKYRGGVQNPEMRDMYNNHDLEYYAGNVESFIETVLDSAVGAILVM